MDLRSRATLPGFPFKVKYRVARKTSRITLSIQTSQELCRPLLTALEILHGLGYV